MAATLRQRSTQSPGETKSPKVVQIDGKQEEPIPFTPPNFTVSPPPFDLSRACLSPSFFLFFFPAALRL